MDFSTLSNPLGPPIAAVKAAAAADIARRPDPDCADLVAALARHLNAPADHILVGNGATQLIHLVTRVFVHAGQRPVVFAPTIGTYAAAAELAGGRAYPWTAQASRDFRWNLNNKPDVLRRVAAPLVYLCNPNNPTGVYLGRDQVAALAAALASGPLLLDETYAEFVTGGWPAMDLVEGGRVIVVRSMSQAYALAGLRVGYIIAHPHVIEAARRLQPRGSVNGVGKDAAIAALMDDAYLPRTRAVIAEARRLLVTGLRTLGLNTHEGSANFVMVDVGDAAAVREKLSALGLAVKACDSFGLPGFLRIAVRPRADCERLLDALAIALDRRTAAGGLAPSV
jgi:histidinol-phosphate aminotransferase